MTRLSCLLSALANGSTRACRLGAVVCVGLLFSDKVLLVLIGCFALLAVAACDINNPLGQPASEPVRACTVNASVSPCTACEHAACCTALEECTSEFAGECDALAECWQGIGQCPAFHDYSSQAVAECLQANCTGSCPGPTEGGS